MGLRASRVRRGAGPALVVAMGGAAALLLGHLPTTSASFTATTHGGGNTFAAASTWCTNPGTMTATVLADAEVDEKSPNTNLGNQSKVQVRSHTGDDRRVYVKPALPAVSSGCTLQSAVLTLSINKFNQTRTYLAYRAAAPWASGTITWANQPGVTGAPTSATTANGATWSIDVTPQIRALYAAGAANNTGLRIQDSAESDSKDLNNTFNGIASASPEYVTYTWG